VIAIEEPLVRSRVWAENASLRTDRMLWERIQIAEKVMANPKLYARSAVSYCARERVACRYRLGTIALRNADVPWAEDTRVPDASQAGNWYPDGSPRGLR